MWSEERADHCSRNTSHVACHSCRRRKVKCDRELPSCQVCLQTDQLCDYPDRLGKPGPKIGTVQRRGRKTRDQTRTQSSETQQTIYGTPPESIEEADLEPDTQTQVRARRDSGQPPAVRRRRSSARAPRRPSVASALSVEERPVSRHWEPQLNMHDLSFILHPSHEASTPVNEHSLPATATPGDPASSDAQGLHEEACRSLGLSQQSVDKLIRVYFDNMVAINIFHEPSFKESLGLITSRVQLTALLAAIVGYAVRFVPFENDDQLQKDIESLPLQEGAPGHFVSLASQNIKAALDECGDEPPPLCLLQALILATHCQLTQGVRGISWRSLGSCVRLAYELNLHLLDSRTSAKPSQDYTRSWAYFEERRRAWWAIWEMDVFASTIRRTPTAIDWAQMEVLLPAPDSFWYQNTPTNSCFFEQDPGQRWRALQESGNESPKAWFIIINSLMKDAQVISCPRGVPLADISDQEEKRPSGGGIASSTRYHHEDVEEARQKLETLANSVYCLVRVLPEHLQYRQHQYLAFPPRSPGVAGPDRQLHCSIYNIYVMTQLARLMIYRYDVFRSQVNLHQPSHFVGSASGGKRCFAAFEDQELPATRQYFEAADNILSIVNRSSDNHIRHINPFLSSTMWLAAAVQLFRKQFRGPATQTTLIKTRFDVLYLAYKQSVQFWETHTAMQKNLEAIEAQLEGHGAKPPRAFASVKGQSALSGASGRRRWIPNAPDAAPPPTGAHVSETQTRPIGHPAPTAPSQQAGPPPQHLSLPETPPTSDALSISQPPMFDPNTMPTGVGVPLMNCEEVQGQVQGQMHPGMEGLHPMPIFDGWEDFDLPNDVRDMLSGYSTF